MNETKVVCYDCGSTITEWVMENRQVSGGDGVVYAADRQPRPVHVNRVECRAAKEARQATQLYSRQCPVCGEDIAFVNARETETMLAHLLTHPPDAMARVLERRASGCKTIASEIGLTDKGGSDAT